jgi:hypothetical protein
VGDRRGDQVRIADRGEIDEVVCIREVVEQLGRDLEAQAGLAGAAGAAQCDQANVGPSQQRCHRGDLAPATDQRGWLRRQVGAMSIECLERREAGWQVGGNQWAALIGFDLANGPQRAADPFGQLGLSQVARFAAALDPRAERRMLVHRSLLPA